MSFFNRTCDGVGVEREEKKGEGMKSANDLVDVFGIFDRSSDLTDPL